MKPLSSVMAAGIRTPQTLSTLGLKAEHLLSRCMYTNPLIRAASMFSSIEGEGLNGVETGAVQKANLQAAALSPADKSMYLHACFRFWRRRFDLF